MKVTSFVAYWKPLSRKVLWVVAWHPKHTTPFVVLSTDIELSTHDVLHKLYAPRWSIETTFFHMKHQLATFMYRFWLTSMDQPKRKKGNLYLHRMPDEVRDAVLSKIKSYNYFIQSALIAQGILQIVSILHAQTVRRGVGFYVRTIRDGTRPSEMLVRKVLSSSLTNFCKEAQTSTAFVKFLQTSKQNDWKSGERLAA